MTSRGKKFIRGLGGADGILYVTLGVFVFLQGYFSSEEAYKYVNPFLLFWLKGTVGGIAAGAGALKMYRSGGFQYEESKRDQQDLADKARLTSLDEKVSVPDK